MSKIKNYIINEIERVEKEFKSMEYDVLFDKVFTLIHDNKEYDNLNDIDKYDYLIDNLLLIEYVKNQLNDFDIYEFDNLLDNGELKKLKIEINTTIESLMDGDVETRELLIYISKLL